jgi:hypothetical protein
MAKKKTWTEKLNDGSKPVVKPCPIAISGMKPGQMMLIPTPRLIDDYIRALPPGSSLTVQDLRSRMAAVHGAEVMCPITTGFHLRTVAEAAHEAVVAGAAASAVTPFWRVMDAKSATLKKLSFDPEFVLHQRRLEGLA